MQRFLQDRTIRWVIRFGLAGSTLRILLQRRNHQESCGCKDMNPLPFWNSPERMLCASISHNKRAQPAFHVENIAKRNTKPKDFGLAIPELPVPMPDIDGSLLHVIDSILADRRRGKGYQWITLMKGAPQHDAAWQPTRYFVDDDCMLTATFLDYIKKHNLLPYLHWRGCQYRGRVAMVKQNLGHLAVTEDERYESCKIICMN